jgi:hypothetical protein
MVFKNIITFNSENETKTCRQNFEVTKNVKADGTNSYQYVIYSSYFGGLIFN